MRALGGGAGLRASSAKGGATCMAGISCERVGLQRAAMLKQLRSMQPAQQGEGSAPEGDIEQMKCYDC